MSRFTSATLFVAKVAALTVVLLFTSAVGAHFFLASAGSGADEAGAAPPAPSGMALILAVLFVQALALGVVIVRSRWRGWPLVAAVAALFFGTVTLQSQLESLVYLGGKMPTGMLPGLFAMGLVNAAVFAPLAVLLLGRWPARAAALPRRVPGHPARLWMRVAVAALVFVALYYLFGYYVAWKEPAVREYYGGTDPGSFFAQLVSVARGTPWMLPFQYLRGLLWAGLGLLAVRSIKGRWWEAGPPVALLFTVPALYLLLPNPLMPDEVRMTHLIETAPYQFLFGWFAAWWLGRGSASSAPRRQAQGRTLSATGLEGGGVA